MTAILNNRNNSIALQLLLIFVLSISNMCGQDIVVGHKDSIDSEVLQETRKIYISLPEDYYNSDKAYPVLYRLDGDMDIFLETTGIVHRLANREEVIPEMIVVLIENTNRNRDMMPTNTWYYKQEPGADKFKKFITDELFLHMSSTYKVTDERILCGQSLSTVFTMYCLLTSPAAFDLYIASSAGFPDCEEYFINLTNKMLKTRQTNVKKVFLSYGGQDVLDPQGVIKKQLSKFTRLIEADEMIEFKYNIYENEGHVPYQSLYHGLKYLYE